MLNNFFNPRAIAVIGASREKGKIGGSILANILKYGYRGRVYPVNPKSKKIQGLRAYPSVLDISATVDLAMIVVPSAIVAPVLAECGKKKIKYAVIITAGFREVGGEGVKMENEIKEIAAKFNIKILGPNCLGFLDSVSRLNASFADGMIQSGRVAFLSQSGAIATAMLDWAGKNNLGFSRFISLGNKAGITENEILDFLINDKNTDVVLGYLEGISAGREFMSIASRLTQKKPFILVKAGKSDEAQRAISSHTGSLAGADAIIDAALKQCGVTRAESLEELFGYARVFSTAPRLAGNNIAVVVNAGGVGVMTTDAVAGSGLKLAKLSPRTTTVLKLKLPATANIHNPIDVVGDARADRYEIALSAVLSDKNVDGAIVILTPQTVTEVEKTAAVIVRLNKRYRKPLVASFVGGERVEKGIQILNRGGVVNYLFPEDAVKALDAFWKSEEERGKRKTLNIKTLKQTTLKQKKDNQVDFKEMEGLMRKYGITMVRSELAESLDGVLAVARKVGYPVVMKVVASKLVHKTDVGGVLVNLKDENEVKNGYKKLAPVLRKFAGAPAGAGQAKVLIQPMIKGAKEIIIGMKCDPQFGPTLMFGLGGIYVEILKDVVFRVAPINKKEALKLVGEIKAVKLLQGARGEKAADIDAIAEIIVRLGDLALAQPEIQEIDINPAMVFGRGKGVKVVDARIITN